MPHRERHRNTQIGWLRASIMGANDGIVSTGSLLLGVAASGASAATIVVSGLAGLVAGAMSMAAGEYVAVSAQADSEAADRTREMQELAVDPARELDELAAIHERRGLDPELARRVAEQLTARDALGAHLRDELGQTPEAGARPVQAAAASAAAFSAGAAIPLTGAYLLSAQHMIPGIAATSLVSLVILGVFSARAAGTPIWRPTLRVAFWGALAMVITGIVGKAYGVSG